MKISSIGLLLLVAACAADTGPGDGTAYGNTNGGYGTDDGYGSSVGGPVMQPDPMVACDGPTFAEMTAFSKCVGCHTSTKVGPDRKSAPVTVNFDTEAGANASAARAAAMVMSGAMPPPPTGVVLTVEEKQQIYAYANCLM